MSTTEPLAVEAVALEAWVARILEAHDLPREDAALAAALLVDADRRGQLTHGVARLDVYIQRLRAGEMKARPDLKVDGGGGILRVDGDGGLGQVVASRVVDMALERLSSQALQAFFLSRSGHLGALGTYVRRAAERGLVGFLVQVSQPVMAPPGSLRAAIGNNPLAFAAPLPDGPPLVFDMSCSTVARGNVQLAARAGQPIPEGWAIGRDGQPTTDPQEALLGAMLPVGDYKGLGLAMVVQILAGSLTGALPQTLAGQGSAAEVGAFGFVVDPDQVVGRAAFDSHMRTWTSRYLEAVGPHGRLPGRGALVADQIALPPSVRSDLIALGERTGIAFPH